MKLTAARSLANKTRSVLSRALGLPPTLAKFEEMHRTLQENKIALDQLLERFDAVCEAVNEMKEINKSRDISIASQEKRLNEMTISIRELDGRLHTILSRTEPGSPLALYQLLAADAERRSAEIVLQEMPNAIQFFDAHRFWKYCLEKAPTEGAHCEFGVYSAASINYFASLRPDTLFDGFDSFEGLPEEWSGYQIFDFNLHKVLPEVRQNVRLHVGLFDKTLPAYAEKIEDLSFLHIDCDLYSSTVIIFKTLGHKIRRGAVIVFDEYFLYPNFQEHELKAFAEFLQVSGRRPRWIACCGQRTACILD